MKRAILSLLLAAMLAGPALAAEPEPVLSLDALVAEALAANPVIAERRGMRAVAERRVAVAGAWSDPMLTVANRNMGLAPSLGADPDSTLSVGLSQTFPWPGKVGQRQEVARREVARAEADIDVARAGLVGRLKAAYYDLYAAYRAADAVAEVLGLLEKVAQVATARYGAGQAGQAEVLKARLEIARMSDDLIGLEAQQEALKGAINVMLGRPPQRPLGRPQQPAPIGPLPAADQLLRHIEAGSPALQAAAADVARAQAALELARKEYQPDVTVMGGYMNRGGLEGGWEVSVSLDLPFLFRARPDRVVAEAAASAELARLGEQARRNELLAMLPELLAAARSSARQEELYRTTVLPQARLTVRSAIAGYGAGKADFQLLFDSIIAVRTYERQYAAVVAAGHKAAAAIEALGYGPLAPSGGTPDVQR